VSKNVLAATAEIAPTRSRTRNVSFEARDDVRFTIGAEVDPSGIEPEFPVCRAGVLPLDDRPALSSGDDGNRTHRKLVASQPRPLGTCVPTKWLRNMSRRQATIGTGARPVFTASADIPLSPVAEGRLELPRPCGHELLSLACLPFHHSAAPASRAEPWANGSGGEIEVAGLEPAFSCFRNRRALQLPHTSLIPSPF
jgi:hypothetical protein